MFLQLSPRINCKYAKSVNELIQFISSFFEATSEIADERRLADKFNHLAYQVDEFFKNPHESLIQGDFKENDFWFGLKFKTSSQQYLKF